MSFPEDLPHNARYWPQSRLDELRAMANSDAPADPAERARRDQWFKEFARDAPAWMDVEPKNGDLIKQVVEMRAYAKGMLVLANEILAVLEPAAPLVHVETPEYDQLKKDVSRQADVAALPWNFLTNLPGPASATIDSNQKLKAGLAKLRRLEAEAAAPADSKVEAASVIQPVRRRKHTFRRQPHLDAYMAKLADEMGVDVAAYIKQSFGNRRISPTDVKRKMARFVGLFKSPHSASRALAQKINVEPPTANMMTWVKERAEVFCRDPANHMAVWLAPHGRKTPRVP